MSTVNANVLRIVKKTFPRERLIELSERDGQKPFGTVLDWLRDQGIPKSRGWEVAEAVCKDYGLMDN